MISSIKQFTSETWLQLVVRGLVNMCCLHLHPYRVLALGGVSTQKVCASKTNKDKAIDVHALKVGGEKKNYEYVLGASKNKKVYENAEFALKRTLESLVSAVRSSRRPKT